MLTFASYTSPRYHNEPSTTKHHPDVYDDMLTDRDEDFSEDLLEGRSRLTYPGETIASSQTYMRCEILLFICTNISSATGNRGHGTYVDNDEVIASVAGSVERVNKLITVKAIRARLVL